jgi:hypothetical protein
LIARLEELRDRQGPLVDDLDFEPLAITNGQGDGPFEYEAGDR